MLITIVDSNPDLNWDTGPDSIRLKKWGVEIFNGKLYVPENKIKEVFDDGNTFNGFDEVYLFHEKPKAIPKNHFPADGTRSVFSQQVPKEFLLYFKTSGAMRYLSDGLELNFACESKTITEKMCELETN